MTDSNHLGIVVLDYELPSVVCKSTYATVELQRSNVVDVHECSGGGVIHNAEP